MNKPNPGAFCVLLDDENQPATLWEIIDQHGEWVWIARKGFTPIPVRENEIWRLT